MKICTFCRQQAPDDATECPYCSHAVIDPNPIYSEQDKLQRAADYKLIRNNIGFVRKNLGQRGLASIIFGIIAFVMGMSSMGANSINEILALIGAGLIVEGAWLVISPTPAGLILDGFALVILGIWNILMSVMNDAATGGGSTVFFRVLGIFQIGWGFQSFRQYKHVSKPPVSEPPTELLQRHEQIMEDMSKMTMADEPTLVEFTTRPFSGQMTTWKARLNDSNVVFVACGSDEAIYTTKADVVITNNGKILLEKRYKADFKLGNRNFSGFICPEALERYEKWKQ